VAVVRQHYIKSPHKARHAPALHFVHFLVERGTSPEYQLLNFLSNNLFFARCFISSASEGAYEPLKESSQSTNSTPKQLCSCSRRGGFCKAAEASKDAMRSFWIYLRGCYYVHFKLWECQWLSCMCPKIAVFLIPSRFLSMRAASDT
jgi:hypothetical protein